MPDHMPSLALGLVGPALRPPSLPVLLCKPPYQTRITQAHNRLVPNEWLNSLALSQRYKITSDNVYSVYLALNFASLGVQAGEIVTYSESYPPFGSLI